MDPSFWIMPLKGEEGDCINQPEDWPNTKEGIDRFYRHWSRPNNVSGKNENRHQAKPRPDQAHVGIILDHLRRRGVHMNYAQLGVFDTVTLGWVAGAHLSFSYRDEMKERLGKLMKGEHSNLHYALFPRAGIATQIMKSENISPAKFREDMVQQ
jgi:hypothetical protein